MNRTFGRAVDIALVIGIVLLFIALSGCSTKPGRFDNLLLVSLTGDRAFIGSLYSGFGFTAELRADDAREIKRMREQARDAEEMLRMLSRTKP